MTSPSGDRESPGRRKTEVDPMMLPPQERIYPTDEPEQGPRWLHFIAGLIVGFLMAGACSKFLERRFGIAPMNTMATGSLVVAVAGASLRGKLWRWLGF